MKTAAPKTLSHLLLYSYEGTWAPIIRTGALPALAAHQPKTRCAAKTSPNVNPAITTSPIAPTANGFSPCFESALKLVRSPTPANVSKNAQRERFASAPICSLEKNAAVARVEMIRNPNTNLGNFCHKNLALFPTACACPRLAQ